MTRESAIAILEEVKTIDDSMYQYNPAYLEALEMAIAALKAEPCEDAVKRESVLNTLDTMDKVLDENRTVESYKELLKECYKTLPPVTPKPKTGKWIFKNDNIAIPTGYYQCSECKDGKLLCKDNFCPNCGAEMEGESE